MLISRSLPLASVLGLALFGLAGYAPGATAPAQFTLADVRGHRIWGPYPIREGARFELDGRLYELRARDAGRLAFLDVRAGEVYGPLQAVDGRLVEISGRMYSFAHGVPEAAARAPLPPVPPPPPRPAPIPIPDDSRGVVPLAPARAVLPPQREGAQAAFWIDAMDNTPLKWTVDGRQGSEEALKRTSFGGGFGWRGWTFQGSLSGAVSSDDIIPTGLDVSEADLDDGTGWLLAVGYRQPFLREAGWEVYAGAHMTCRHDEMTLNTRSAVQGVSTNGSRDLTFSSQSSDLSVDEFAIWLDAGLSYSQPFWGVYADLSVLPFNDLSVDGGMPYNGLVLPIEGARTQPLTVTGGGWIGEKPWRFFTEIRAGSDQRLRIGVTFAF